MYLGDDRRAGRPSRLEPSCRPTVPSVAALPSRPVDEPPRSRHRERTRECVGCQVGTSAPSAGISHPRHRLWIEIPGRQHPGPGPRWSPRVARSPDRAAGSPPAPPPPRATPPCRPSPPFGVTSGRAGGCESAPDPRGRSGHRQSGCRLRDLLDDWRNPLGVALGPDRERRPARSASSGARRPRWPGRSRAGSGTASFRARRRAPRRRGRAGSPADRSAATPAPAQCQLGLGHVPAQRTGPHLPSRSVPPAMDLWRRSPAPSRRRCGAPVPARRPGRRRPTIATMVRSGT